MKFGITFVRDERFITPFFSSTHDQETLAVYNDEEQIAVQQLLLEELQVRLNRDDQSRAPPKNAAEAKSMGVAMVMSKEQAHIYFNQQQHDMPKYAVKYDLN